MHIIDPTLSAQVIEEHLGIVIQGILLVDRYSAYKSFARKRDGILLAFCWSRARRDFLDAGKKISRFEAMGSMLGRKDKRLVSFKHT